MLSIKGRRSRELLYDEQFRFSTIPANGVTQTSRPPDLQTSHRV
ncbi:hypothetical protein [Paenibacillus sp. 19GGS1-52]|nr:hypothetical protein [Paenibacillus sp. 19GGS1-52]